MKLLKLISASLITLTLVNSCSSDETSSDNPQNNNPTEFQSIEEARDFSHTVLNNSFGSLQGIGGQAHGEYVKEIQKILSLGLLNGSYFNPKLYKELLLEKIYEVAESIEVLEEIPLNVNVRKLVVLVPKGGIYAYNPTTNVFDFTPTNDGKLTVEINSIDYNEEPINYKFVYQDNASAENPFQIYGPVQILEFEQDDTLDASVSDNNLLLYPATTFYTERNQLYDGTITIYNNNIEVAKFESDIINYEYETGNSIIYFTINENTVTQYKNGELFSTLNYSKDNALVEIIYYNSAGEAISFTFEDSDETLDHTATLGLYTLPTITLALEYHYSELDNTRTVTINHNEDEIVFIIDYSLINDDFNEYAGEDGELEYEDLIKNIDVFDAIVGGTLKSNNELVFTLNREGENLYADYEYENTRVDAREYIQTNFQAMEDAIEEAYFIATNQ